MDGATISHYRILEKLGEGGMGIVYKAEDLKLQRTVALKFLPQHLTATHEEQERFLQEARAASALNHPNVCTIYAIEEEKEQAFIAMEFVEGKTVREKIEEGIRGQGSGISRDQAISYAIQIGEALQEAHTHGIIHRDIKADNIMVNLKNQIKVMDFGLAKLKGSLKLTKTTSTVGTLSYMAPEQIEHETVDARSDLFSMGVVLYEMLTGHLPFRGEHEAAMMYSILNEEPEPIQQYLPDISSELVHIVNRALDKDPEDRYQSAHDMVIDLRRLKKQSTRVVRRSETAPPAVAASPTPPITPRRGQRMPWLLGAGVAVVAVVLALLFTRGGKQLNPEMKFHVLQTPLRDVWYGDLSIDGNWIVCSGADENRKFDVYMMNVASGQTRRVTTESGAPINGVALSPDGSTILFARLIEGRTVLLSVPSVGVPGGQRIAYAVNRALPGHRTSIELWTSRSDGSDKKCELSDTIRTRPGIRTAVSFSPDCKSVAWTRNGEEGFSEIIVRNLETGHEVQLTNDRKFADDPLWLPNNYVVFSSTRGGNCNLWAAPATGGGLVQVTRGSGPDAPIGYSATSNRLVYIEMQQVAQIKVGNLESGSVQQLTIDDRIRDFPSISENGRYVAFSEQEGDATSMSRNIYVVDRQEGTTRKLTNDDDFKTGVAISPDASWILYSSRLRSETTDSTRVFLLSVSNPGQRRLMGHGTFVLWLNNREFCAWHFANATWYKGSIDRQTMEETRPDSVANIPIAGGTYTLSLDVREARQGWWITPTSKGSQEKTARQLRAKVPSWFAIAWRTNSVFYTLPASNLLERMSLPSGKPEQFKTAPPKIPGGEFGVTPDGKEIAYTDGSIKARYVAIEDFLR
jgi:Tol biopolymer transport system component